MSNILFGIFLGIGISYIASICVLACRKLRVIIKEYKERHKLYYGLSKNKRIMLDEVIRTYKNIMKDLDAVNDADKSFHRHLLNIVQTLTNRTMQTAYTIGGENGLTYVQIGTKILYYDIDKK